MQLQILARAYALVAVSKLPIDVAIEGRQDAFGDILARKAGACVAVAGVEYEGRDLICDTAMALSGNRMEQLGLRRAQRLLTTAVDVSRLLRRREWLLRSHCDAREWIASIWKALIDAIGVNAIRSRYGALRCDSSAVPDFVGGWNRLGAPTPTKKAPPASSLEVVRRVARTLTPTMNTGREWPGSNPVPLSHA